MKKHYLLASDFDQTLSFNDSGIILSEVLGVGGLGPAGAFIGTAFGAGFGVGGEVGAAVWAGVWGWWQESIPYRRIPRRLSIRHP